MTDPNWPRPADEPRSQPFQPVSYSFEPEFTPPPPPSQPEQPYQQPPYQQPAYPPQQQPAYQQQPPAYQPQPVPMVPAQAYLRQQQPPKRRGRKLKITLAVIGSVMVLCGIGSCIVAIPVINDYGATVDAPDQLPGGLTKTADTGMQSTIDDLKTQLNSDLSTSSAVAGYYDTATSGHAVLFVGASTIVLFPGTEIDNAFKGLDNSLPVTGIESYPAGTFGGTVKCGASTSSGVKLALCVWADHGTVGVAAFFARTPADAAPLFLQIREATEQR